MNIRIKKRAIVTDGGLVHKWAIEMQEKKRGQYRAISIRDVIFYETEDYASKALANWIFNK